MSTYSAITLDGALVAITGAARGIGLATAKEFAGAGSRVALGDIDADMAREAAAGLGDAASGHALDVTDKKSFAAFLAETEAQHGRRVDVLVNNAGIMPTAAFLAESDETIRRMIDINLLGVIHGMQLVLPQMVERGNGHVANVASLAGKFPLKGLAVYNASKYAVVGLTAATRLEMAPTGVSITAILPSAVRTELITGLDLGILPTVDPEDIAKAVVQSVKRRPAEVAVPKCVGGATKVAPLVPERVMKLTRRLAKDDVALRGSADREAYLKRISGD